MIAQDGPTRKPCRPGAAAAARRAHRWCDEQPEKRHARDAASGARWGAARRV